MCFFVKINKIFVRWREVFIVFSLQFCLVSMADAKDFDYSGLTEAKTGRVDQSLVRYLAWTKDRCIVVQTLVSGGAGKVKGGKEICSLNGKSFYDGFTHVGLEEGRFENGVLFFEIETMSLPPIVEKKLRCEVVFHDDLADHFSCRDSDQSSKENGSNYSRAREAGTGRAGGEVVRYLAWSEDECIVIQNLIPGGKGKASAEKKICSYDDKSFYAGYAAVDFKNGYFKKDRLFFELGFYPLRGIGETNMICEVVFSNGLADHLSCQEYDEAAGDCECNNVFGFKTVESPRASRESPTGLTKILRSEAIVQTSVNLAPAINENHCLSSDGFQSFFDLRTR